jgi:hypothetical protein
MKRQIQANIGIIAKKKFQLVETVIVDTVAQFDEIDMNLAKGQVIDRDYVYTFASIEEAVEFFGVPADWALENGRKKWGKAGGAFYGYEVAENGEATVWANF